MRGGELTDFGGTLFFAADDGVHGRELWCSDGTDSETILVKDLEPGPVGAAPSELAVANGVLFFVAADSMNGRELWRSDGTASGTARVKDINPGPADSSPRFLTALGDTLLFLADDGVHGSELWRSDGTDYPLVGKVRPCRSHKSFSIYISNT